MENELIVVTNVNNERETFNALLICLVIYFGSLTNSQRISFVRIEIIIYVVLIRSDSLYTVFLIKKM